MIYIQEGLQHKLEWTILRGVSKEKEDFSRADVILFLLSCKGRIAIPVNAVDGVLYANIPTGLEEGVYGVKALWTKKRGCVYPEHRHHCHHHHHDDWHCDNVRECQSIKAELFCVSNDTDETIGGTIKLTTNVATYGYDGLDAYELSVLRGKTNLSEDEWLDMINRGGTIEPTYVDVPMPKQLAYTGEEQKAFDIEDGVPYSCVGLSATNAGEYEAVFTLADTKLYKWNEAEGVEIDDTNGTAKVRWSIEKMLLTKPQLEKTSNTYNGKVQDPVVLDFDGEYMGYDDEPTSCINAGLYTFNAELKDSNNTAWTDESTDPVPLYYTIDKLKLTKPTLKASSVTYSPGTTQKPEVLNTNVTYITIGGETEGGIDAGTYDVTASLNDKNNTCWADDTDTDLTLRFTINKKQCTITWNNPSGNFGNVNVGEQITFEASVANGSVTFKKNNTTVITSPYTVTEDDYGILTKITASHTPTDPTNYTTAASVEKTISVKIPSLYLETSYGALNAYCREKGYVVGEYPHYGMLTQSDLKTLGAKTYSSAVTIGACDIAIISALSTKTVTVNSAFNPDAIDSGSTQTHGKTSTYVVFVEEASDLVLTIK